MDRNEFLKQQIADAQRELDADSITAQHERNVAQQRSQFASAQRAVVDARQRHETLVQLAITHLADLRTAIEDAHQYRSYTGIDGAVLRQHVIPGHAQFDPAKKGAVDAAAMRLAQTLTSEFQMHVRLEHNEKRFSELSATAYASVAPKPEPAYSPSVEGEPESVAAAPAPVSTKNFVTEALASV